MSRNRFLLVSLPVLVLCIVRAELFAQTTTGTVLGTASDQSGAVLPGAEITLLNLGTNQGRTALTNERGEYSIPMVPIGSYKLTAVMPGFKTEERQRFEVQVDQRVRIDFTLEVGAVSEKVLVTEEAPLVQSSSASLGSVVDNRKIAQLPLNSRDFEKLALLVPGATPPQVGSGNQYRGGMTIAGQQERANNFSYDGTNITSPNVFTYTYKLSVDEIQEFKVLPNSYDAQSGRGQGGMIVVTSKSGSNEFHLGLFEFIRNDVFDARNFFNVVGTPKPPIRRNQFGGNLGGPIARDKSFFFYNFEGLYRRDSETRVATVPSLEMRRGDFSALSTPIRDPLTGQPFAGNIIPPQRIHPFGATMMSWYPSPMISGATTRNLVSAPKGTDQSTQNTLRLDHTFSPKDNVFARYSRYFDRFVDPFNQYTGFSNIAFPRLDIQHNHAATLSYTHVFSPTVLNTAKAGFSRLRQERTPLPDVTDFKLIQPLLPIPGIKVPEIIPPITGIPAIRPNGVEPIGYAGNQPDGRSDLDYQYTDTLSWVKGNHSMKFGFDYERAQIFRHNYGSAVRGDYRFDGRYTGNGVADMLLGLPSSALRGFGGQQHYWFQNQFMFYIQDDYKISPRLTLNLGLRYENYTPWFEKFNRASNYIPETNTVELSGTPTPQREYQRGDQMDPLVAAFSARIKFVDTGTKFFFNHDNNNYAPRLGFAWDAFGQGKFLVRGGTGTFFVNPGTDYGQGHNYPFRISQTFNNPQPNATTRIAGSNVFTLTAPFAGQASSAVTMSGKDKNARLGYVQKYSLGFQWEFRPNFVADIDYMGSLSRKLGSSVNINQPPPGSGSIDSRRPIPNFGSITVSEPSGNAHYNALQTRVERRFSGGMTFTNSYTWQKVMETQSSSGGGDGESGYQDPLNRKANKGPAAFDFRHRWVFSVVYELPVGRGRSFLTSLPKFADAFLGGWEISGIQSFQTGGPYTPTLSGDNANTGGVNRPNRIRDGNLPKSQRTIEHYFDTGAFVTPERFTFGNSGRNILYGPSFANLDFSLMKIFTVGENRTLQFRSEFFNILNHPNFALPSHRLGTPQFGGIFQAFQERQIQFGLKFKF